MDAATNTPNAQVGRTATTAAHPTPTNAANHSIAVPLTSCLFVLDHRRLPR